MRHIAWAGLVLLAGCAADPQRWTRPTRFQVGANTRTIPGAPASEVVRREVGGGEAAQASSKAVAGNAQFTSELNRNVLVGGELEFGALETRGSSYGAAYGIVGLQHLMPGASFGAELAGGYRTMRFYGEENINDLVLEPRLRAQFRVAPQFTFGAVAGTTLGEQSWMAGFYLGVHSHRYR